MATKHVLNRLYRPFLNAPGIIGSIWPSLFQDTVGIGDCTSEILVDELKQLKASECCDIERIGNIYHALHKLLQSNTGSEQSDLKAIFENEALIYVPSDDASSWYKVSQCVWSSAAKLRGRVSLTDDYKDLEEIFVGHLGVRPVDLAMIIDELRQVAARDSTTVNEIKDFIWIINSLLPSGKTSPVPQDILRVRIFPVRYPNGRVQVRAYDTDFFIIDRESLGSSFESKVKLFDFKLEQVARLRPYIEWLNMQGLYISSCVEEITSFMGGKATTTSNPERQIHNRAHAMLRVAAHFDSPLQGKQTTFHIDEKETSLKVYLPRAKDVQEYIFTNVLPKGFAEWMMPDPGTIHAGKATPESLAATKNIMLASHSLLSRALADSGIATIDVANCYETVIPETPLAPRKGGGTHKSDSDSNWSDLAEPEALDITGKASSKQHRSSYGGLHGDSEALNETRYVALLDNIIAAGRRSL
ncbi:hypothetical protein SGCOL_011142 [Colletotrichum sp. CLE4]